MDDKIIYILLGLVALLVIIVIAMMVIVSRLRSSMSDMQSRSARNSELMQQSIRQDIQNVSENVRGLQSTMQQTVSQSYTSLNQTLDNKLQNSFNTINNYMQVLNRDLGEMKSVASGIEDVKKVLSNVKTRGILGEIQLGSILREILAPQQYAENIATVPNSTERVEFALKLPADGETVYLPIDSKFPGDAYAHLLDAYDRADENEILATKKVLVNQFKTEAKAVASKYVKVPYTTDFAIMFLPFEGLYAEAVNLGVIEILQNEYNIVIAGPSTMAALLNSLQMGFRTLAIQENAQKSWKVLGCVKTEFERFAGILDDTQKKITKVSENLDTLIGVRTRAINRALRSVEKLEGGSSLEAALDVEYSLDDSEEI